MTKIRGKIYVPGRFLHSTTTRTVTSSKNSNKLPSPCQHQLHPKSLRGVYPVLITPFNPDKRESIDLDSFRKCLSFMKHEIKCQGVTITGVLGEANRLTDFEKQILIQAAVEENRKDSSSAPFKEQFDICVGVAHSGTAATIDLCQMAAEIGADSVMVSPSKDSLSAPQPSEESIVSLFEFISDACPATTIVLQDLPSVSGVHMSMDLMVRMVTEIPQLTTVKLESTPTITRIASFHAMSTIDRNSYSILTGLGALYAGFDLCHDPTTSDVSESKSIDVVPIRPTDGFMTGFAFPEVLMEMMHFVNQHQYGEARHLYQSYLPLIVLEQQPGEGLALRKEIYRKRGLIASSHVRQPGKNLSATLRTTTENLLERLFASRNVDIEKAMSSEQLVSCVNE
ncbi:dihydrodipicolinate synthetase [Nitzschia inconspicua]|uniref:Dihydrodipicolinate synthetase n=1 Tax=Nitzschia inconspicua TaxID=303405 RepID=A0A9K3PRW4_9STRA|nr:dihydrodipicolinate synthetase [Nitzschia inconspicua]